MQPLTGAISVNTTCMDNPRRYPCKSSSIVSGYELAAFGVSLEKYL